MIAGELPLDGCEPVPAEQPLVPVTFPAEAKGAPATLPSGLCGHVTCLEHAPLDPSEATGKRVLLCVTLTPGEKGDGLCVAGI